MRRLGTGVVVAQVLQRQEAAPTLDTHRGGGKHRGRGRTGKNTGETSHSRSHDKIAFLIHSYLLFFRFKYGEYKERIFKYD